MAEQFTTWAEAGEEPPVTKYPWHLWTDGNVWLVRQGIDYQCQRDSFITNLHGAARRMGLKVSVRSSRTDDALVRFQFTQQ